MSLRPNNPILFHHGYINPGIQPKVHVYLESEHSYYTGIEKKTQ